MRRTLRSPLILVACMSAAWLAGCDDSSAPQTSHSNDLVPGAPTSSLGKARQSARDLAAKAPDGIGGQGREAVIMRAETRLNEADSAVTDLLSRATGDALTKARAASAKLHTAKTRFAAVQSATADNTKVMAELETALTDLESAIEQARKAAD